MPVRIDWRIGCRYLPLSCAALWEQAVIKKVCVALHMEFLIVPSCGARWRQRGRGDVFYTPTPPALYIYTACMSLLPRRKSAPFNRGGGFVRGIWLMSSAAYRKKCLSFINATPMCRDSSPRSTNTEWHRLLLIALYLCVQRVVTPRLLTVDPLSNHFPSLVWLRRNRKEVYLGDDNSLTLTFNARNEGEGGAYEAELYVVLPPEADYSGIYRNNEVTRNATKTPRNSQRLIHD